MKSEFKQYVKMGIAMGIGSCIGKLIFDTATRRLFYVIMDNSNAMRDYVLDIDMHAYRLWKCHKKFKNDLGNEFDKKFANKEETETNTKNEKEN